MTGHGGTEVGGRVCPIGVVTLRVVTVGLVTVKVVTVVGGG